VSDTGGKTDVRWSAAEWGWLCGMAEGLELSPGRVVKELVLREMRGEPVPAAPEGEGSGVSLDRRSAPPCPAGSAGCFVPGPPAGDGVVAGVASPASAAAPAAPVQKLERAVAAALGARFGARDGLLAMARRDIRSGKVRVDGVVCIDPERLVEPGALS
jgi:hypothetical protein